MDVKLEQQENILFGIRLTFLPMVNVNKFGHSLNTGRELVLHLSALKTTDVNPEHLEKAYWPIVATESGIFTDFSFEHSEKASSPITVTESGIVTDVNSEHSKKAHLPMSYMEIGISTDFRLAQ